MGTNCVDDIRLACYYPYVFWYITITSIPQTLIYTAAAFRRFAYNQNSEAGQGQEWRTSVTKTLSPFTRSRDERRPPHNDGANGARKLKLDDPSFKGIQLFMNFCNSNRLSAREDTPEIHGLQAEPIMLTHWLSRLNTTHQNDLLLYAFVTPQCSRPAAKSVVFFFKWHMKTMIRHLQYPP